MTYNGEYTTATERKEIGGICVYPITMRFYKRFIAAREAWKQRQSFLPVKYLFSPFLEATFDYMVSPEPPLTDDAPKGCFFGILEMLILALRLDYASPDELLRNGVILKNRPNGTFTVDKIRFVQDGELREITPKSFKIIRQIVADQNGIELPDESENVDILRSYREKQEYERRNAQKLKANTENVIDTVAYLSGLRTKDIMSWTVKEFECRKSTVERVENFRIFAQAELSGMASFKKGNPCPSLFFDVVDDTYGTASLEEADLSMAKDQIEAARESAEQTLQRR
ncbi:MAG: hypothetical protein J6S14_14845 [Clostridia bacterium]|nr:hypothetical protein [Clostridia bacterium]